MWSDRRRWYASNGQWRCIFSTDWSRRLRSYTGTPARCIATRLTTIVRNLTSRSAPSDESTEVLYSTPKHHELQQYVERGSASSDHNQCRCPARECQWTSLAQHESNRLLLKLRQNWSRVLRVRSTPASTTVQNSVGSEYMCGLFDFTQLETAPTHSEIFVVIVVVVIIIIIIIITRHD